MKKIRMVLAMALCTALFVGLLPVPAANAAGADNLRQVVANHAKMLAETEWMSEGRVARLNHPEEKTQAMHDVGVRPPTYFEYHRTRVAYKGVIMENTSASYEKFRGQLQADGTLLKTPNSTYYGMNQDSFLVDVVSRVSPTPITGVKQAMTSDALVPLLDGVKLDAPSSVVALESIDPAKLTAAYGKLRVGDLLISWDDNAKLIEEPTLSVLVVTGYDDVNIGQLTVTYPAYEQPTYYFQCSKCNSISTEGPTSAIIEHHVKGASGTFSHFTTHKEVHPEVSCNGTWKSLGSSTWHTSEVSFDQLDGRNGNVVAGDAKGYIPYTLAVYGQDEAPEAEVKVTTEATAASVVGGFEAHIESNYRIVQVDAVLSQPGSPDKVFTNYPEWTDWSYDFQNDALDLALVDSGSGQCTLTLNVYTGPKTDPNMISSPVVEAYKLEIDIKDPVLTMSSSVANGESVLQGGDLTISVQSLIDGISRAEITMRFDPEYFEVDLDESRRANPDADFSVKDTDEVIVKYTGPAVNTGATLVETVFRAKRVGYLSVDAKKIRPFTVALAWVAKNGETQLEPERVDGEQLRVGLGLNVVHYKDYAAGKDLVLVPVLEVPAKVTYEGSSFADVSAAKYRIDGQPYTTTYGMVGENFDLSKISAEEINSSPVNINPGLLSYNGDIDNSGMVDIIDVQTIADIINGVMPLDGNMNDWLRADMDRNGKLDINDMKLLLQQVKG